MTDVISLTGLVKTFGRRTAATRALDGLDLAVAPGEVHGLLGPNGAGKSTTLRILLSLLRPDSGEVRLFGRDAWKDAVALHRRLAYVPGDVALWPDLSGGQVLAMLAKLRGRTTDAKRMADLLERFDLDPGKKGRAYSKGNRQKVMLVAAFASETELLVLDEPTSGLDPLMEAEFRTCLAEEKARGRTVLLSSHILSEVEEVCDRVSIVRRGRVAESGTLTELRHLTRTLVSAELGRIPGAFDGFAGLHEVRVTELESGEGEGKGEGGGGVRLECTVDTEQLSALMVMLGTEGIRSLTTRPPTLEELFLRHYADPGRGRAEYQDAPSAA
ncbi:ABC transporter related [Catenulispora acidiphila DSM 44928]|uniref:ABC transporter related n=1 Tax=Catenulispora acidiphila (strain DSM 44928 / JCM 14897 / NBRC 102108 / NRRL B-24433 / ID139908) TaxID=479433 RepID=C7QIC6_CATAD|nr:ABC transporter ATP-binding protein [Catenulispora acidiphila]ACU75003.1 ABC transporter related [Catenulispora acidiphila DSM 44928]